MRVRVEEYAADGRSAVLARACEFSANGRNARIDAARLPSGNAGDAAVRYSVLSTAEATFILSPVENGSYAVKHSRDADESTGDVLFDNAYSTIAPFSLFGMDLLDLLKSSRFVVTANTEQVQDGRTLRKIAFELLPDRVGETTLAGWVLLSPRESWAIREVVSSLRENLSFARQRLVTDYVGSDGSIPLVRSVSQWSENDRTKVRRLKVRDDVSEVIHADVPLSEFSLAAFGLAELGSRTRYVKVVLAGCLLLLALIVIFRRAARAVKSPA